MAVKSVTVFPKLLLFGDSLTQHSFSEGGWGAALADHFQRKCDVLNRGFSGYTSAMNKLILPRILQCDNTSQSHIVAAVVLLGSNDAVFEEIEPRGIPVPEYVEHMTSIIQQLVDVQIPRDKIVMLSPPPVCEQNHRQECAELGNSVCLSQERTSKFAEACVALGNKLGVSSLDLHLEILQQPDWKDLLTEDGVHFSVKGNRCVAELLVPLLREKLKDLPEVFPDWKDIDPKNLDKTLQAYTTAN